MKNLWINNTILKIIYEKIPRFLILILCAIIGIPSSAVLLFAFEFYELVVISIVLFGIIPFIIGNIWMHKESQKEPPCTQYGKKDYHHPSCSHYLVFC